jgi:hypothetical protein
MDGEIDINIVLQSMREQIGQSGQEKAILAARIAQLEAQIKEKES